MKSRFPTRPTTHPPSSRQLALALDCELRLGLDEPTRQAMLEALADLLLEALGQEISEAVNPTPATDESQNLR
jgi:hypothetical protein